MQRFSKEKEQIHKFFYYFSGGCVIMRIIGLVLPF